MLNFWTTSQIWLMRPSHLAHGSPHVMKIWQQEAVMVLIAAPLLPNSWNAMGHIRGYSLRVVEHPLQKGATNRSALATHHPSIADSAGGVCRSSHLLSPHSHHHHAPLAAGGMHCSWARWCGLAHYIAVEPALRVLLPPDLACRVVLAGGWIQFMTLGYTWFWTGLQGGHSTLDCACGLTLQVNPRLDKVHRLAPCHSSGLQRQKVVCH